MYGPPAEDYDASSNQEEDVYGPPQDFGTVSKDEAGAHGPIFDIDISNNIPEVVYGPPAE